MRQPLLVLAIFQLAYGSCPTGYDLVSTGQCRGHQASMSVSFDQGAKVASSQCGQVGAQPVTIHNEEQQSFWKSKAPTTSTSSLVLGITCNVNTKRWEWADGSSFDYKPATNLYNPELDKTCTQQWAWTIKSNGYWGYVNSGTLAAEIYCTSQLKTLPAEEGCDKDDKVCYQASAASATWQDGQKVCRDQGMNLASIHTFKANSYVRKVAVASGATSAVFIGASANDNQPFSWVDGTTMDFEYYAAGFPKANFGQCVAMDTSNTAGEWMNVDCNTKLPFACGRKGGFVLEPECHGEDWREGEIITSPGFPNSAYTLCDYSLTVATGRKVRVEIDLEANSCCDSLILYDGYTGNNVIATLTGELHNATFTTTTSNVMRVSWQPKGGVNVRGLVMTYHAV